MSFIFSIIALKLGASYGDAMTVKVEFPLPGRGLDWLQIYLYFHNELTLMGQ